MKRPDPLPQDDPEEWMDHALSDLRLAGNRLPGLRLAESVMRWVKGRL